MSLKNDCKNIIEYSLKKVQPDVVVKNALNGRKFSGRVVLVSVGKAGWTMADAAVNQMGVRPYKGIIITKYGHSRGPIGDLEIYEAGHPVPDNNSFKATGRALELTEGLKEDDTVLFLLSGGGSALFEKPLIREEELQSVTNQLLGSGAEITEVNTIRKRLSAVKGGRFATHILPAKVISVVLSDVLGNRADMIASGPTVEDCSSSDEAVKIVEKYGIKCSDDALRWIRAELPKRLENTETIVSGSVSQLCRAGLEMAEQLGYKAEIITDSLDCEAKDAGAMLGNLARENGQSLESLAFLAGGETVVHLTGKGKGGRNQEVALAAALEIQNLKNVAVFSFGSDGTDGPTDAAGGYADGETKNKLELEGIDIVKVLKDNDAYNALKKTDGLIFTGPTGTNVNDLSVVLIRPETLKHL